MHLYDNRFVYLKVSKNALLSWLSGECDKIFMLSAEFSFLFNKW